MEICKEMIASNWKLFHAAILILLIAWWDSFQDSWSGRTICIMHHHSSSCIIINSLIHSFIICMIHYHSLSSIILHHHSSLTISHSSLIINHQSSLWIIIHQPSVITVHHHPSSILPSPFLLLEYGSLPPIATDHQPHEAEFMISTEMENSRSIRVNGLLWKTLCWAWKKTRTSDIK